MYLKAQPERWASWHACPWLADATRCSEEGQDLQLCNVADGNSARHAARTAAHHRETTPHPEAQPPIPPDSAAPAGAPLRQPQHQRQLLHVDVDAVQALHFQHKLALLEGRAAVDAPKASPLAQAAGSLLPLGRCNVAGAAVLMVNLQGSGSSGVCDLQ